MHTNIKIDIFQCKLKLKKKSKKKVERIRNERVYEAIENKTSIKCIDLPYTDSVKYGRLCSCIHINQRRALHTRTLKKSGNTVKNCKTPVKNTVNHSKHSNGTT